MKRLIKLFMAGVVAGLVLGILLKSAEAVTGKNVYTLLLNVDYIPVLSGWPMMELHEFILHLIVSIVIVSGLYFVLKRTQAPVHLFALGAVIIGGFYFPLTVLSARTPEVTDAEALIYWLIAHSVYGYTAGVMIFSGETGRRDET